MSSRSCHKPEKNSPSFRHLLLLGSLLFLLGVALYGFTTQKGVAWQDSGTYQWRVVTGDYQGNIGLASAHPLYIATGRLFLMIPIGDPATRLNMLSVFSMSLILAFLGTFSARITSKLWIGFFTALIFSQMHTVWWLATIAESYPLYAVFFIGELWVFVEFLKRPNEKLLILLFLINGLSLNVHNFALVSLPVYVGMLVFFVTKKNISVKYLFFSIAAFCVGASIYLYFIFDLVFKGESFAFAASSALFGDFSEAVLNVKTGWSFFKVNAALASLNFIGFVVPFAIVGWVNMRRELDGASTFFIGGLTLLHFIFVARYAVPDQFMFLLPSLLLIMLAASLGMKTLCEFNKKSFVIVAAVISCVIPLIIYVNFLSILSFFEITVTRKITRPFRDEIRYWAVPWKHNEFSAELFAAAALEEAAPKGMILSDNTSYYPLLLVQKRDQKSPGVTIQYVLEFDQDFSFSEYKNNILSTGVYTVLPEVTFFPKYIRPHIEFIRDESAVLYRAVWKENDL